MGTLPRPRRLSVHIAACLAGVSLVASPALGDTITVPTTTPTATAPATDTTAVAPPTDLSSAKTIVAARSTRARLAVGDSLMVGASPLMRRHGFSIHAKVGRQFSAAPRILRGYGRALPRNVVIELGTNGTVQLATCRAVVRAAGRSRTVFLVTNRVPRSWQDPNNATLRACDRSFAAKRVRIIDWHAASAGRPDWFAADGVHTSAKGRRAFAALIDRAVDKHGR